MWVLEIDVLEMFGLYWWNIADKRVQVIIIRIRQVLLANGMVFNALGFILLDLLIFLNDSENDYLYIFLKLNEIFKASVIEPAIQVTKL